MHRLTVGMPVRNGAAHIAHAIDSFLRQTFRDFELIVYDNASTDNTADIVRDVTLRDSRVSIVRHAQDIGGAKNFILAAERAMTPLFCWAAHDDLREPTFLQTLVDLLDAHPDVALACSAVRNMDPDGTLRDVRPETASLRTTTALTTTQRIRMYLRDIPGTPFYGVFRTQALKGTLHTLHELDRLAAGGPALLGIDMIFLARFLGDHGLAVSHEPLVLFRRGGVSHNLGRYGSMSAYARQLRIYRREMRRAASPLNRGLSERLLLWVARNKSFVRWMLSRDMRRMTAHYLTLATPMFDKPRILLATWLDPSIRRLRSRLSRTTRNSATIVLFGAGKHTRQRWRMLQRAIGDSHAIVACCDDRADSCDRIDGLRVVPPAALAELKPDVLLVSSDTYERTMFERACAIAPPKTMVWSLYDVSLEASIGASTDPTNADTSANASQRSDA